MNHHCKSPLNIKVNPYNSVLFTWIFVGKILNTSGLWCQIWQWIYRGFGAFEQALRCFRALQTHRELLFSVPFLCPPRPCPLSPVLLPQAVLKSLRKSNSFGACTPQHLPGGNTGWASTPQMGDHWNSPMQIISREQLLEQWSVLQLRGKIIFVEVGHTLLCGHTVLLSIIPFLNGISVIISELIIISCSSSGQTGTSVHTEEEVEE